MSKPKPTIPQRFRTVFRAGKQDDHWFFGTLSEAEIGMSVAIGIGRGFISKKPYFWVYKLVPPSRYRTPCLLLTNKTFRWRWPIRNEPLLNKEERTAVISFIRTHKAVLLRHWNDPYLDFLKAFYEIRESIEKHRLSEKENS